MRINHQPRLIAEFLVVLKNANLLHLLTTMSMRHIITGWPSHIFAGSHTNMRACLARTEWLAIPVVNHLFI